MLGKQRIESWRIAQRCRLGMFNQAGGDVLKDDTLIVTLDQFGAERSTCEHGKVKLQACFAAWSLSSQSGQKRLAQNAKSECK